MGMVGTIILLTGCAALAPLAVPLIPNGSANAEFHSATTVKLERKNFTVVKTNVVGEARGFSLLGIITLKPARFSEATDRLYEHAEMRPGQAQTLANTVVERSSTFLILYSIPRVSIRADVVEFVPEPQPIPPPGPGPPEPISSSP